MRFHVLGVPHSVTSLEYVACAFTQKVLKWCRMMSASGEHEVFHYGHERSEVECTEHISVTTDKDLSDALQWHIDNDKVPAGYDPVRDGFIFDQQDAVNIAFRNNVPPAIRERYKQDDFLLCFWGTGHLSIVNQLADLGGLIVVEPGIGYPMTFCNHRVFESFAKLHLVRGQQAERHEYGVAGNMPYTMPLWFDTVIPNYWDPSEFDADEKKDGSLFFIGRLIRSKGLEIALKLAESTGRPLKIAGQGEIADIEYFKPNCDYEFLGVVNQKDRNVLMSRAEVGLTPSLYIEPFCGTHVEFWLNKTGILTTPWGVFAETVINGYNGYKCTAFSGGDETDPSFIWGLENIDRIDTEECYKHAVSKFSLEVVKGQYENYFRRLIRFYENKRKVITTDGDLFFF